jgi:hypothetical protein
MFEEDQSAAEIGEHDEVFVRIFLSDKETPEVVKPEEKPRSLSRERAVPWLPTRAQGSRISDRAFS